MSNPPEKLFRLKPDEITDRATGRGACFATDMITVEGRQVAFMYREEPDESIDSGWRFMAGYESQAYMDDPSNSGIYDVNTIANYDPAIIPYLSMPPGTRLDRVSDSREFTASPD